MIEPAALSGRMQVVVNTAAQGFGKTWQAVLADFHARHPLADVLVSINDVGATPAVVSLRLDQAVEAFEEMTHEPPLSRAQLLRGERARAPLGAARPGIVRGVPRPARARRRVRTSRSSTCPARSTTASIVGEGTLDGRRVLAAAQEGAFIGGSVGEVHGAKIVGLLARAVATQPAGVLLLLESGGVRLHEANAGLIAISEIMRALLAVRARRHAGRSRLIGGANGCFGGMGIVARCCDRVIMSEEGRLALSGPEVIETVKGVEEFDSRDRALVWRTTGGKHRYLLGEADVARRRFDSRVSRGRARGARRSPPA